MSNPRYPEEFNIEEVEQLTERGLVIAMVAARIMTSPFLTIITKPLDQVVLG